MRRRVVITGLGAVTPLGHKVGELWHRLLAAESGIHLLRILDTGPFKIKFGGDIYDWNPVGYLEPREMKRVDRFTQFALVAGIDAVSDAGIDWAREDVTRWGVILGSGLGGLGEIEEQMFRLVKKGADRGGRAGG